MQDLWSIFPCVFVSLIVRCSEARCHFHKQIGVLDSQQQIAFIRPPASPENLGRLRDCIVTELRLLTEGMFQGFKSFACAAPRPQLTLICTLFSLNVCMKRCKYIKCLFLSAVSPGRLLLELFPIIVGTNMHSLDLRTENQGFEHKSSSTDFLKVASTHTPRTRRANFA